MLIGGTGAARIRGEEGADAVGDGLRNLEPRGGGGGGGARFVDAVAGVERRSDADEDVLKYATDDPATCASSTGTLSEFDDTR